MSSVSIVLVHYPVLDRQSALITTAITNLDLHDMARTSCVYGLRSFFVVHPVLAQRDLAMRIKTHWTQGSGAVRIPTREAAMTLLEVVPALSDVFDALGGRANTDVYVTSARSDQRAILDYPLARQRMSESTKNALIVFGTGWGLAPEVLDGADGFLPPIRGTNPTGYNHLSVRAACAIILDRLFGSTS